MSAVHSVQVTFQVSWTATISSEILQVQLGKLQQDLLVSGQDMTEPISVLLGDRW